MLLPQRFCQRASRTCRHGLAVVLCAFGVVGCQAEPGPAPGSPASPGGGGVSPVVVEPVEPTAEGWLTVLEASAGELKSLVGRVRMTTVADLLDDETMRWGNLQYAAADDDADQASVRFAVRFERVKFDEVIENIDQAYIYDGRWLLDLDGKDRTATRRELVRAGETADLELGDGPFLLPLNLKRDRVLRKFEVQLIDAAEDDPTSDAGTFHLRLIPRPTAGTDAKQIDLWFDRDSLLPRRAATLEADDDQIIIDLFDLQPNVEIADEAFDTALPDDDGWQLQVVPLD